MGMSIETYLSLTAWQFYEARKKFFEKVKKDRDFAEQTAWQVARWQLFKTLCPPKAKQIRITDLIQLPGDLDYNKKEPEKSTEERFNALAEIWEDKADG